MLFGGQTMTETLRRVVVRRPDASFAVADPVAWNYTSRPDPAAAGAEHDALVELLVADGIEIIHHDPALPDHADSIFVHDPVLVTDGGAIVLRMGKPQRRGEEEPLAATLEQAGVPRLGALLAPAVAEGGDIMWIDPATLAVGIGFRTNQAAAEQLGDLLPDVEIVPVQLPYHLGPHACLHLMSLISMLDADLAVTYVPLLPVTFVQFLERRGIGMVEVPTDEWERQSTNVLATAPRRLITLEGNPVTRARLEEAGCQVRTYVGDEITLKAEGGATCLTRPVLRQT